MTGEYYENLRAGALSSARVVAPLVYGLVQPKSVMDLGCGTGEWLSVFAELGAEEILGVEHPGFDRSLLSVPSTALSFRIGTSKVTAVWPAAKSTERAVVT